MKRLPIFHTLIQCQNETTHQMKANAAYGRPKTAAAGLGNGVNSLNSGTRLSLCPVGRAPGFAVT